MAAGLETIPDGGVATVSLRYTVQSRAENQSRLNGAAQGVRP